MIRDYYKDVFPIETPTILHTVSIIDIMQAAIGDMRVDKG